MISNKYKMIEKINQGSFGTVIKAENIRTKELVAIKFEKISDNLKSLKNEAKIYQYLGNKDGFPQLKMYGTFNEHYYMALTLLGEPLSKIILHYKALSKKTVLNLGIQIIKLIETLHSHDLIHRDIKPSNFIFGLNDKSNKLHLIDLGFAKRYNYNGTHIQECKIRNIIGSVNFVSLNVHNFIEPSRRDDLESCVYVILTMLFGNLDWFSKTNLNEIYESKRNILTIPETPKFIIDMLFYIQNLGFNETPDYAKLKSILISNT